MAIGAGALQLTGASSHSNETTTEALFQPLSLGRGRTLALTDGTSKAGPGAAMIGGDTGDVTARQARIPKKSRSFLARLAAGNRIGTSRQRGVR